MGAPVDESTNQKQAIARVRVYPGADGHFTLYSDDGSTYAYEQGKHDLTELHWDDAAHKLQHTGAAAWKTSDAPITEVVTAK